MRRQSKNRDEYSNQNQRNSESNSPSKTTRRAFGSLIAGTALGSTFATTSAMGQSTTAPRRDQTEEVLELYKKWADTHGGIEYVDTVPIRPARNEYRQNITYKDGETHSIIVRKTDSSTIEIEEGSQTYNTKVTSETTRSNQIEPELASFGQAPSSDAREITEGPRITPNGFFTSANDCVKRQRGGLLGSLRKQCSRSDFRSEAYASGAGVFYGVAYVDTFIDLFIAEPSSNSYTLTADFSYYYDFSVFAVAGNARCFCQCKITDLSRNKTLSTIEVADESATIAGLATYSDSGTVTGAAQVEGQTTYRIGIRAFAEAAAGGTALSTADIINTNSDPDTRRFELYSLSTQI